MAGKIILNKRILNMTFSLLNKPMGREQNADQGHGLHCSLSVSMLLLLLLLLLFLP
jgi:hypothetical protein